MKCAASFYNLNLQEREREREREREKSVVTDTVFALRPDRNIGTTRGFVGKGFLRLCARVENCEQYARF